MPLTLNDITPIGLCVTTQELFDTRRYRQNFCDSLLLREKDKSLEQYLVPLKRDINSIESQRKFVDGHKATLINNIDKIISIVATRYAKIDYKAVESIVNEGKSLIKKLLFADTFDQIGALEPSFRKNISLPVYSLFLESIKRFQ